MLQKLDNLQKSENSPNTLILVNANIITLDPNRPRADAIEIQKGKIKRLGSPGTPKHKKSSNSEVIDCQGKTVLPAFIDPHIHLLSYAESLVTVDLGPERRPRSISDILRRIREVSLRRSEGHWIRAKGYHEYYLREERHPTRWDLDEAAPRHPVKLSHQSGHAHVLNTLALKMAEITKETPEPQGAIIERDLSTGEPNGLLFEMGDYLSKKVPPVHSKDLEHGVKTASRHLLSLGITSIQDLSSRNNLERLETFANWKLQGKIQQRISMMMSADRFDPDFIRFLSKKSNCKPYPLGIKIILDQTTGELKPSPAKLEQSVMKAHKAGLQVAIHAIELNAIQSACSAIEHAQFNHPRPDSRHRVEHASVCTPMLAQRIASLGVIVVTQPSFIYYNGDRYIKTVPRHQLPYLYPIGSLMKNGVTIAASSDCPVVPPSPFLGIYSAVTRKSESGRVLLPDERISSLNALQMYTRNAALAGNDEEIKGSLSPGYLADLIVVNKDPTEVPTNELKDISVEMTVLGGKIVWSAKK